MSGALEADGAWACDHSHRVRANLRVRCPDRRVQRPVLTQRRRRRGPVGELLSFTEGEPTVRSEGGCGADADTTMATDPEQLFVVSDSPATASTHPRTTCTMLWTTSPST